MKLISVTLVLINFINGCKHCNLQQNISECQESQETYKISSGKSRSKKNNDLKHGEYNTNSLINRNQDYSTKKLSSKSFIEKLTINPIYKKPKLPLNKEISTLNLKYNLEDIEPIYSEPYDYKDNKDSEPIYSTIYNNPINEANGTVAIDKKNSTSKDQSNILQNRIKPAVQKGFLKRIFSKKSKNPKQKLEHSDKVLTSESFRKFTLHDLIVFSKKFDDEHPDFLTDSKEFDTKKWKSNSELHFISGLPRYIEM